MFMCVHICSRVWDATTSTDNRYDPIPPSCQGWGTSCRTGISHEHSGCTAGLGSGPHPYPSHILSIQSGLNFRKNNQPGRAVWLRIHKSIANIAMDPHLLSQRLWSLTVTRCWLVRPSILPISTSLWVVFQGMALSELDVRQQAWSRQWKSSQDLDVYKIIRIFNDKDPVC